MTPTLEAVLATLERVGADGLNSNRDIPREILKAIQAQGYEWHVYTVDDLETAKRFKQWGARSITTNVPGHMKKHLVELGLASLDLL